jgi:replicative DNA helicase
MNHVIPPQSPDIERAVLGIMLLEPETTIKQTIEAGEEIFYMPQYRLIFKAIEYLYEHGDLIDQFTVCERLKHEGRLEHIGGEGTIAGLLGETPGSAFIERYLKILREKTSLRSLISLGKAINNSCNENKADPAEIMHNTESQLVEIKTFMEKKKLSLSERIREWVLVTEGDFFVTECYKELNLVTVSDKCTPSVTMIQKK